MRNLPAILRGGYCTRWHANPDLAHIRETLAEHHARVAQIILALHPAPSAKLIDAALHHDAGEPAVGDLPVPFKRAHPGISAQHAEAEAEARMGLGCHVVLTGDDLMWLTLADRLAAMAHVAQVRSDLLGEYSDWADDRLAILDMAAMLGIAATPAWCLVRREVLG